MRDNSHVPKKTSFTERLHDAMVRQGLRGPVQLGLKLGVNKQTASKWINGETRILSAVDLFKIADGLKVRPRWLLTGDGPMDNIQRPSAEEQQALEVYRTLPPHWREDWVADGRRTLEKLTLPPSAANPYPKVRLK